MNPVKTQALSVLERCYGIGARALPADDCRGRGDESAPGDESAVFRLARKTRSAIGVIWRMLFRFLPCLLAFAFACPAWSQMEHEAAAVDLTNGLAAWHGGRIDFDKGGEVMTADGKGRGLEDFTVSFSWQIAQAPGGEQPVDVLSIQGGKEALVFSITPADGMVCRFRGKEWHGAPRAPAAGRPVAVALSARRDNRQALAGLWIDGVEAHSLAVAPGAFPLQPRAAAVGMRPLAGWVKGIRIHERALGRAEIFALALDAAGPGRAAGLPPFGSTVSFLDGEVIAVLGGDEAAALMEDGRWEAALLLASPGKRIRIRSLAWEADTVFRRDRPMNFGSLRQQLQRVEATCALLMFGRLECLELGEGGLAGFAAELQKLVSDCQGHTRRIVLIGPPPFEKKEPPLRDLSPLNAVLARYRDAIAAVAKAGGLPFADAGDAFAENGGGSFTRDGLRLNAGGMAALSQSLLSSWGLAGAPGFSPGLLSDPAVRKSVAEKNRLWHEYWRPSNWAFLHGDRTAQPSSRDHLNPSVRWFPAELEKYRDLIAEKETLIWKQAAEAGGKLP